MKRGEGRCSPCRYMYITDKIISAYLVDETIL